MGEEVCWVRRCDGRGAGSESRWEGGKGIEQ